VTQTQDSANILPDVLFVSKLLVQILARVACMKMFHEIHANDLKACSLKHEMEVQGYVLIRKLLPCENIHRLLDEITKIIYAAGWLLPEHHPLERMADITASCGGSDPAFKRVYEQIFNLEYFHAFAHHPVLQEVMHQLVGQELLIHPKPIGRLIFPNCERLVIHAHQDHQSIGGEPETFTAWMPLHDCPSELGPLQILEASHRFGLQPNDPLTGFIASEQARGGDWVGGQINAGDVLIFHSLTVHAASPNISSQLRISVDCRFQNYRHAFNPAELAFPGSSQGRSWESTYTNWRSKDLQYFWKKVPLQFKPSMNELAQLAQTADSPEMKLRYARILNQLKAQM